MGDELAPFLARRRDRQKENNNWRVAARALITAAGNIPLTELSAAHIREAQESYRGYKASSRYAIDFTFRRVIKGLIAKGAPNLLSAVTISPQPAPRQVQPTQEELKKIINCRIPVLRFVLLACAEAGLRSGTAVRLRPADIINGGIVTRTKKGAATNTPISPRLAAIMGTIPDDANPETTYVELLSGEKWKNPTQEIYKRWARWRSKVGIRKELHFHDMRRGLARRLYAVTGDIRAVQSLLSHRTLSATVWYLDAANRRVDTMSLNAAIAKEDSL